MDQLRKTGTDGLLKKELANGKLMIGESAGAIICAPSIQYIEQMDEKPEDYSPMLSFILISYKNSDNVYFPQNQ